jgi:hypothetical protein
MEGSECVVEGCDRTGLILPFAEYSHELGCAVIGGHVYRGSRQPALQGVYLFGDYCSGRIWGIDVTQPTGEPLLLLDTDLSIGSFGEHADGEVYVADIVSGSLYRVAAVAD